MQTRVGLPPESRAGRGPSRHAVIRAVALAACLFGPAACGEPGPAAPPVLVWIGIDTLRADALGCYGSPIHGKDGRGTSPNLDALAAEGVRFETSYSSAPWTVPALATQMTGKWPWDHGGLRLTRPLGEGNETLAETFRDAGWRTAGVMTNFVARVDSGLAQGFELWDDSLAVGGRGSTGVDAADVLLAQTDRLLAEGTGQGLFLFLFLFEPHYFYELHPEYGFAVDGVTVEGYLGARSGALDGEEEVNVLRDMRADLGATDISFLRARYHGDVAAADDAVGRLAAGLEQRGLWRDATVLFAADHGEEIMERGWIGHTNSLFDELVRVPFIVRTPALARERRGTVVTYPVSQIDFRDTVLDLAGIAKSRHSLVPTVLRGVKPERRFLYLHTDFEPPDAKAHEKRAHLWGVYDADRGLKWIVDHNVADGVQPYVSLYDLERDPLELENLAGDREQLKRIEDLMHIRGLIPYPLEGSHGTDPIVIPGKGPKPNGL